MKFDITPRLISIDDIIKANCFDFEETIKIIEKAFVDFKNGKIDLPDKISQIFDKKTQNRINCMPATLKEEGICGVKWVSVFPENPRVFNVPNVSGTIILSNITNGFPIAIMDGTLITALRTACVGAIGAKHLARKNSEIYATIGSGEQAKMHFMSIKSQIPSINECRVAALDYESEMKFINELKDKYKDVKFVPYNGNTEEVSRDADIIVTAVSCQKPLLKAKTIKKGAFYCHVGGWEDEYEVPLMANKIVCDMWESVKHRTQTISRLYCEGKLKDEDIYSDIVHIIDGTVPGRETEDEFIYFNSVGLAFIDVSIAHSFYKKVIASSGGYAWNMQNKEIFDYLKND